MGIMDRFKNPPNEYGAVAFYWWVGEKLDKQKIKAQLEMLKDASIVGLQINYAHDYKGGNKFGLTYKSEPELFSDEWWNLLDWFIGECNKYGISVSLSDYTLSGVGQGWYTDTLLAKHPEYHGKRLILKTFSEEHVSGKGFEDINGTCLEQLRDNEELLQIFRKNGNVYGVCSETVYNSIDPMAYGIGSLICSEFFEVFEKKTRGKGGKELNYFFSDELDFGMGGFLWNEHFEEEFFERKGYEIRPNLLDLFLDRGEKSVKVRLDYYDVMVALEEENYFQVIYDWHEKRNMIYGCDHGSRGYDPIEFGDYFRTQKYNQGPGCDQPMLQSDIVKNKVASSISRLYGRQRVWLEGFYGSGWGTTTDELMDAIARNYVMGHNLYGVHGLYYTTLGGWWEWAPPCNGFRMPYWDHMKELLLTVKRMSYLLSQGDKVADVAIYYPVADSQFGYRERKDVEHAFRIMRHVFQSGIDADFIDADSIRAHKLAALGYKILIMPFAHIIPQNVMNGVKAYVLNGGTVLQYKEVPHRTDAAAEELHEYLCMLQAKADIFESCDELIGMIDGEICRDVSIEDAKGTKDIFYTCHRKIGNESLFMIYGEIADKKIHLREKGQAFLLDVFSGNYRKIQCQQEQNGICFTLGECRGKFALILVTTENYQAEVIATGQTLETIVLPRKWGFETKPVLHNKFGDFSLPAYDDFVGIEVRTLQCGEKACVCTYGPYMRMAGPFFCREKLSAELARALNGIYEAFVDYDFSLRYGRYGDPGIQGYHGLKGKISDDFIVLGERTETLIGTEYVDTGAAGYLFYTNIIADGDESVRILQGNIRAENIYIDGEEVSSDIINMKKGAHKVISVYRGFGRTHLMFAKKKPSFDYQAMPEKHPLSMRWYRNPDVLHMDAYFGEEKAPAVYSFLSAPGLYGLKIDSAQKPRIEPQNYQLTRADDGSWKILFDTKFNEATPVRITYDNPCGEYGGAIFKSPVKQLCGSGIIESGDWSSIDGLRAYSGAGIYSNTFRLEKIEENVRYFLRMDEIVSSATVRVNGKDAGHLYCKPWKLDITEYVKEGDNRISMEVYNTLANQYETIPTRYQGSTKSGIIGNVYIEKESRNNC